jgi:hypothetical protein
MKTYRTQEWGNVGDNPLLGVRNRLKEVREGLPFHSHWRNRNFINSLSTFSYHCWRTPYCTLSYVRGDITRLADDLRNDLEISVEEARGKTSLPESTIRHWILRPGTTEFDMSSFRGYLMQKAYDHVWRLEIWREQNEEQRRRLMPALSDVNLEAEEAEEEDEEDEEYEEDEEEEDEEAEKAWDKERAKLDADREAHEALDADIKDLDKHNQELQRAHERGTLSNPTVVSPRSPTGNAGPSKFTPVFQNQPTSPSLHKGKSMSTTPKGARKPPRKDATPPNVAGPSHSAASPQSFAAPSLAAPAPHSSVEPWNLPTPNWAFTYKPGMLAQLGLEVGKFGNDGTDVTIPPNKIPRPGTAGNPDQPKPKAFSWNWGLYTILAKMPGGKARLEPLYQMCLEWCPIMKANNGTCRHSLSVNDKVFFAEDGWWRLADVNEYRKKEPGPEKGVAPQSNWKGSKASSQESERLQAVSPTPAKHASSQSFTSSSSQSPEQPTSNIRLSVDLPAPGSEFTAINRPASVPAVQRKPLPSGPAKRKHDDEEDDSERANKR